MLDRHGKRAGWNREIEQRVPGRAEGLTDVREEFERAVIARNILQQGGEASERFLVDGSSRGHAASDALDQLLARHRKAPDTDDRHVQMSACRERVEGGKN